MERGKEGGEASAISPLNILSYCLSFLQQMALMFAIQNKTVVNDTSKESDDWRKY